MSLLQDSIRQREIQEGIKKLLRQYPAVATHPRLTPNPKDRRGEPPFIEMLTVREIQRLHFTKWMWRNGDER